MRKTIKNFQPDRAMLLDLEHCVCEELRSLLSFDGHAIYFPPGLDKAETVLLLEEKLLLAPLHWQNTCLAMLRLENINVARCRRLLSVLPALLSSLLEKCVLRQMLIQDMDTGLATEDEFFESFEKDAEIMEEFFGDQPMPLSSSPIYRLCKGMIVLSWRDGRAVAQEFDYRFYELVLETLGRSLKEQLPDDALGAILGKYEGRQEFGIVFSTSSRNACHTLARKLAYALEAIEFPDPLGQHSYHPVIFGGHALYPQDMIGDELRLPLKEQAMRLRDRARLGVRAAAQSIHAGNEKIISFSSILRKGGIVTANLGKGRYRINLGLAVNARVGMRFLLLGQVENVWRPKGQMVILEIGKMDSIATIISMERAGELPETGDRLIAASAASAWHVSLISEAAENRGCLCSHERFASQFQNEANASNQFILGISRTRKGKAENGNMSRALKTVAQECAPDLLAPFGMNGLIFFLKNTDPKNIDNFTQCLNAIAEKYGLELETGLFKWPFLNFSRAESEECALKALEYTAFLPYPHIGWFNSMAITMSADRKFGLGDNFGALEEYRLALLADARNAMARNSMGVCLASLGRYEEARKAFEIALEGADNEALAAKIHYNLGVVFQKTGDPTLAGTHYRKCLKKDKSHVFAWLRLGKLEEEKGHRGRARKFYLGAAAKTGDEDSLFNAVQRHLANLEAKGNRGEQARGILHDNLARNPNDAASLALLAKLYLDKNLDPALAEMFARKCASLKPSSENMALLAECLEAQGRIEEAELARARGRNMKN